MKVSDWVDVDASPFLVFLQLSLSFDNSGPISIGPQK
jgi:hypothetical protein